MLKHKRVKRNHRDNNESRRPLLPMFIPILVLSVVSLALFVSFVLVSVQTGGNTGNILGGIGVICLVIEIICAFFSVRRVMNQTYSLLSRIIGLVAPVIGGGVWLYLYVMGATVV